MKNETIFSSRSDDWATPAATFNALDAEFHFNLDPCADDKNHKCERYFTKQVDGLAQNWGGTECSVIPLMAKKYPGG